MPFGHPNQAESPAAFATDGRNSGERQQDSIDWDAFFDDGMEGEASFFDNNYVNYNTVILPPINPNNQNNFHDDLPSFENALYFDTLPRPFPHGHPATSSGNEEPPPSNQQASLNRLPASQYQVAESVESPNSFNAYLDLTPSPSSMPPTRNVPTRSSSIVDLTESSPVISRSEMASATKKRKRESPGVGKATKPGDSGASEKVEDLSKVDLVDLSAVDSDEQYKVHQSKEKALKAKQQADLIREQNQAEANKPVRLAEFQCIICMDNPTDLTVTHCGHLFCSECLHSALHAGDKKCCPVCRTPINLRPVGGRQPQKGIFPLEMKLMTANKKGKQAVRSQA